MNGFNPLEAFILAQQIRKILKEEKPDIVHVHGAWNYSTAIVEKTARKAMFITIVSPHRAVSSQIIGIDFWKQKLPRLLAYQIWTIRNSTAVIAVNEQEKEDILALGLKKRIEVLPDMPKEAENTEILCNALMAIYRKALDSYYYRYVTEKERTLVEDLVAAAVVDEDVTIMPSDTKDISFRRLSFLIYDEDITELILKGAHMMAVSMPPLLNVEATPRYKNKKAKQGGALSSLPLTKEPKLPEGTMERSAVEMIIRAHAVTMPMLTLRHLVELYRLFRYTDFNEDVVAEELKRLKLHKFTVKLQNNLETLFRLKPGYEIF